MVTVWEYTLGDVFLSMLWFTLFFIWIWLLIAVFSDIFRSPDLTGWGKAGWTILIIVLPYISIESLACNDGDFVLTITSSTSSVRSVHGSASSQSM